MQVSSPNDVKVYNLSAGKSLPEWLSDKQKRRMGRKDIDIRRRIELIQDFQLPVLSNNVRLSPDGQYVLVSGIYKPRIRCYDLNQLALKFERCLETEIVKFLLLSTDYSKLIFLHDDRYVEIHNQHGRYHRFRLPKIARDFIYNPFTCDCMFVGVGADVTRFNFEIGSFVPPLRSTSRDSDISACDISLHHGLFVAGADDGVVNAWDSRAPARAMTLNCRAAGESSDDEDPLGISKLKFKDALRLGVGTTNGQVMLYDIRAQRPYYIKDHQYSQPIVNIEFLLSNSDAGKRHAYESRDLVVSMDSKILKIWDAAANSTKDDETGFLSATAGNSSLTSIEPGCGLNDLCVVPGTGMMFVANETPKVLVYFVPAIGPAPKWCQALETITEELEETQPEAYDDYKFVTQAELIQLGLDHLVGTSVLRAYMHGYYIDLRLYRKAKSVAQPVTYEQFQQEKLQQAIERDRKEARVKILSSLPQVNRELALKYAQRAPPKTNEVAVVAENPVAAETIHATPVDAEQANPRKKLQINPLLDERFSAMFKNPDFEMDPSDEAYQLHNAAIQHAQLNSSKNLSKKRVKTDAAGDKTRDEYSSSDEDDVGESRKQLFGAANGDFDAEDVDADEATGNAERDSWLDALTAPEVTVLSAKSAQEAKLKARKDAKMLAGDQRRQARKAERMDAYQRTLVEAKPATIVAPALPSAKANDESTTLADAIGEVPTAGDGVANTGQQRIYNYVTQNEQGGRTMSFKYQENKDENSSKKRPKDSSDADPKTMKHSRQQIGRKVGRK